MLRDLFTMVTYGLIIAAVVFHFKSYRKYTVHSTLEVIVHWLIITGIVIVLAVIGLFCVVGLVRTWTF